ncbi:MAG TPA: DUF4352 domain-containing protein [Thermomicrobiales bacterium]|nr:DUF4352 domain-containing protein [Thermomicrobiales bacterium]
MEQRTRITRRGFAALAAIALPAHAAIAQKATPPPEVDSDQVFAPAWSFRLIAIHDPYPGTLQVPQDVPAGTRTVAIEIEVINDSTQALNFTPIDVRLRDIGGTEFRGGAAIGAEPMINPRNLNPGERSRGSVWFIVPDATELTEVVYIAPQPQFRVSVS